MTSSLDQESTQDAVADTLVDRLPASVSVSAVACPERIERAKGAKVTCTVTLADNVGELPVTAVQRDNDGQVTVQPSGGAGERSGGRSVGGVAQGVVRADVPGRLWRRRICGPNHWRVLSVPGEPQTSRRSVDVTVVDAAGTLWFNVLAEGN